MLKLFDLLGPKFPITIKKQPFFRSNIGGFITIIMILIFIGTFIGFGIDVFLKYHPYVTFTKIKNSRSPFFNITDDHFIFALYDQQSDKPIPNLDKMFTVSYDILNYDTNGNSSHLLNNPFVKCSPESLEKWKSYIMYDPSLYYCFPLNTTIEIKGSYTQGLYSVLRINLNYCNNNTNYVERPINDCISKNETQRILTNKRIQMHYLFIDSLIDNINFSYPISNYYKSDKINTDIKSWSRLTIELKEIEINTDIGFFLKYIETKLGTGIDSVKFENFYTPETDSIFSHRIKFSDWVDVYRREYIKVQGVFAMMGGFVNFSLIILKSFIKYATLTQIIDIFNENYTYFKVSNNNNKLEKNEINTLSNYPIFNKDNSFKLNNYTKLSLANKLAKKNLNKYLYKFDYGCYKSLFRTCLMNNYLKNQIDILRTKMVKVLSFENIIKLTKTQKIMKILLFEDYQTNVFKFCSAPKSTKVMNEMFDFINNSNEMKSIDKKLYQLLKDDTITTQEK